MTRAAVVVFVALGLVMPAPAFALPKSKLPKPSGLAGEPGSGVPLGKKRKAPDAGKLKAPTPKRPRDAAEAAGVTDMEAILRSYRDAHATSAATIQELLTVGAERAKKSLDEHYSKSIELHAARATKLRQLAIKRYQDFVGLHKGDATWTPEIMFRLAGLHFEQTAEDFTRGEEAYEKALLAYQDELEKNPDAVAPPPPDVSYEASIDLYRAVVERFPYYQHNDGSLYMMATLLFEEERFDESLQAYLALACKNQFPPPAKDGSNLVTVVDYIPGTYEKCVPWREKSRYEVEAWLRIGEVHYDFDELDPALEAYARAATDPKEELYDEALIRMAWTQYLKRDFAEAAKTFDGFIRYADKLRAGKNKQVSGAITLRDDAVEYLAKTYAEEDWDGDGRQDGVWGFERLDQDYKDRGQERHVPEIYAALGDLFAYQTDYQLSIEIWETALKRWPLSAAAPKLQLKILQAYNSLQDKEGATRARDALATNYLRGTKWFYANESDSEAVEEALKLAEDALVASALEHHQRAQALRAQGDPEATKEYGIAAKAYAAYLERFPDTASSYEYRYQYADSLYYSQQYLKAAEQYAKVRDSSIDNRLQPDAANGAVAAYESYIEDQKQVGRIKYPDMPKKGMKGPFDKPKEIPEVVRKLQEAYDRYVGVRPDAETAPTMMYLSGELSQRYHHFDDSERRFVSVLERHCDKSVAINAGKAIMDAHIVREDLKGTREWSEKLTGMNCGEGEEAKKFAGELKEIGNAVRFQEANILYEAGEFEAAADRYIALVDQAPADPNAASALNNAAVSYEKIGRFGSATKTYKRIYTDYKDSEFADEALRRTGYNHVRFFEFDEAVAAYLKLAEEEDWKKSKHRLNALWDAADLLDNLQDYKRSAKLFRRYAKQAGAAGKGEAVHTPAEASYRAAEAIAKTGEGKASIRAYRDFIKGYGSAKGQATKAVEAQLAIGKQHAKMGDRKSAERAYQATISMYRSKNLKPASEAAAYPAEAQFLIAEYALGDQLRVRIDTKSNKRMQKSARKLFDKLVVVAKAYDNVFPYRNLDWTLAGMYRRGYAFETVAIKVRAAPVPKRLKQYSEAWFAYKDIIDKEMQRFENKALQLYTECLKRAKDNAFANEWTRAARERMNIYKPDEYPLLRQPALDLQVEDRRK